LSSSQRRAQRAFCENSLQQIGLAFHTFANDHGSKFPMAISTNDGGSLEFVEEGFSTSGNFYNAFRNFQSLSNELVDPQILVCLSDTLRTAAASYAALQNVNLSYFVDVNANFDKPGSVLAGDRNLGTNLLQTPAILQIGPGGRLHWTWEMHRFTGNVLFSDGHVESWNNPALIAGANALPGSENLFLPTVVVAQNFASGGYGAPASNPSSNPNQYYAAQPSAQYTPQSAPAPFSPANRPNSMPEVSITANNNQPSQTPPAQTSLKSSTVTSGVNSPTPPPVAAAVPVVDANSAMSPFDQHLAKTLRHTFEWLYLLLLLLLLLYLIYRLRKWLREREARERTS
jgi:prepilin-type processing-associated H-X9-DG protein